VKWALISTRAATEGIDPKAAVSLIVQDLKSYNQFNSLQKAIQRAQQNFATLNMLVEQRQQAIASLINLQSKGISDTELIELNKFINSWSSSTGRNANIDAGGATNTKTNGFNFKLDDKLNYASLN
jgi:hypothetical protein